MHGTGVDHFQYRSTPGLHAWTGEREGKLKGQFWEGYLRDLVRNFRGSWIIFHITFLRLAFSI